MIIVGSRSLKHHFPELDKKPNDWDFIATESEVKNWMDKRKIRDCPHILGNVKVYVIEFDDCIYEFEIAEEGMSAYDYLIIENNIENEIKYARPEVLYSLKISHIHREYNRDKHLTDYYFLQSYLGEDKLFEITNKRIIETNIRYDFLNI